ncbi:DNA-binding response regulator, OmpR family, contains REC and winged-helix (wHTH) domain [Draconibacterium orientale]|jgi:DNA-binding response OmpR family regulator|uniref:DNA-binding response regulator, OmpR family, contains REC and winged-helix (WHTH) domain n=1 Tax=Draconibacterium orientale TaxID=1168034 RepID=X5DY76_9BACT|nr:response regulator transcription factor [Draconibacterium orientale]AHW59231.1 transcriptional regulator [Draconibacterium orientale]SET23081.1 DNA-binding response regulator, OmpR family, contains REC and winged-helix (wHTH) domain [Draconibacterium orientale]
MEQKTKLLLAEDDENLGLLLKEYLVAKGYDAELYPDGEAAYKGFMKEHFDICVLDVMMPKKDGFTLAKDIRIINADIPIIFLTAKNMKDDVLEGFQLGADDYITKPFSMEELIMRLEAILRRTSQEGQASTQQVFTLGKFTFDTRKQTLTEGENAVKLTTKESDLLKLLCQNANKVLERNYALKSIWIDDNYFNARSMDVYITKLRKHLKEEPSVEIINVHGKGYKLIV